MGMGWYVLRRIAWAAVAAWLVVSVVFVLLTVSPNPGAEAAAAQAAQQGLDPEEARQRYLSRRGLNRPVHVRYIEFMRSIFTLDLGHSISQGEPISSAIAESWVYSVQYFLPSILLSILVGYSIGLISAFRQYEWPDYLGSFVGYFGISIPNFWFAIVLILATGVWLRRATGFGMPTYYQTGYPILSIQNAIQLVLPVIVLSTASVATQLRYSRAQALEYAHAAFVKTARAKGASDWRVLIRHVLRVALVPLSTILIADVLAVLFTGSIVIEFVFNIPGLGTLFLEALSQNDTPLVLTITLLLALVAIVSNLVQDIAYVALDPRIDYGDR